MLEANLEFPYGFFRILSEACFLEAFGFLSPHFSQCFLSLAVRVLVSISQIHGILLADTRRF